MSGRAHISSPEVIKEFRARYAAFAVAVRNALSGADSEIKDTVRWLSADQQTYWKSQLRKREEAYHVANQAYQTAKWASAHQGKAGCVDEKRAMELARRRKEEAEQKMAAVKKWAMMLDQKVDKMWAPCQSLNVLLESSVPGGLSRLDQMLDSLDEYFRTDAS